MGCQRLDARYEDYAALIWRRRKKRKKLVGEHVVAQDIGCENFPERRLIVLAVTVFRRACLSSCRFTGDAQLVGRVGE